MPIRTLGLILAALLIAALGYAAFAYRALPETRRLSLVYWADVEREFRARAAHAIAVAAAFETLNPQTKPLAEKVRAASGAIMALAPDPAAPADRARFRAFLKTQDALSDNLGLMLDFLHLYPLQVREGPIRKVFDELELRESHIVVARTDYVETARRHNLLLSQPPSSWVAAIFDPGEKPLVANFDPDKQ